MKPVSLVMQESSEELRANVSPAPSDETAGRAAFPSVALRPAERPQIELAAAHPADPVPLEALKAFKEAHQLDANAAWDAATERRLFAAEVVPAGSFVGMWGSDASACSPRLNRKGLLPAVINEEGAFAGIPPADSRVASRLLAHGRLWPPAPIRGIGGPRIFA